MIRDDESTPLLGDSPRHPSPPPASRRTVSERVHFLDNLRVVLTVLLISHHAGIFSALDGIATSPIFGHRILPLALFTTVNKSFLYEAFFFVSGYSIHLALATKSDSSFFISRTLKTGVPALLWQAFFRKCIISFLVWIFGKQFNFGRIGRFGSLLGNGQLEGPGSYVLTLLIFDYAYLLTRFAGKHWPAVSLSRLESRIKDSRLHVLSLFVLSFVLVTGITVGNCFGLRLIPFFYRRHFPLESPGFGAPVAYIVAYIAGVNFPIIQRYILFARPSIAVGHLVGSEVVTYVSLGLAQHYSSALYKFIWPSFDSEGARFFVEAGWNAHTMFFSLWNPFVMYFLVISLISTFAAVPILNTNWGIWSEHTYLQTYIHMIPVAIAAHVYLDHSSKGLPVPEAIIGAFFGVIGSWAIALAFVALRRKFGRYLPELPEVDVAIRFPARDVEAGDT